MVDAFTANVKPGGLNSSSQIRILLCYLIGAVKKPLSHSEIATALLGEELVNYFELEDALGDLERQGLASLQDERYILSEKGSKVANSLYSDLPKTVMECAVRAAIEAQQFASKQSQHKANIEETKDGFIVKCCIEDLDSKIFEFAIYMPDRITAEAAKLEFIERGDRIFRLMLAGLTDNKSLAADLLK